MGEKGEGSQLYEKRCNYSAVYFVSNNRELHAWLTARLSCFVVSDEKLDKNEADGVIDQST